MSTWILEVAGVGEAVGADRSESGEVEERLKDLTDVATGRSIREKHTEENATRNDSDLAGEDLKPAQLRLDLKAPQLRN